MRTETPFPITRPIINPTANRAHLSSGLYGSDTACMIVQVMEKEGEFRQVYLKLKPRKPEGQCLI